MSDPQRPRVEGPVDVRRTRAALARRFSAVGKVAAVAAVMATTFRTGALDSQWAFAWLFVVIGLGWGTFLVSMLVSYALTLAPSRHPMRLVETADTLELSGRSAWSISKAGVSSALATSRVGPHGVSWAVALALVGGDKVELGMPDAASAHALVAALGFAPEDGRAVDVDLATRGRRAYHLLAGFGIYQGLSILSSILAAIAMASFDLGPWFVEGPLVVFGPLMLALYQLVRRRIQAPVVRVGVDGVEITRGASRRFIPRAEIAHVRQALASAPLEIVLFSGEIVSLYGAGIDADRRAALGRLLHARMSAPTAGREPLSAFARDGLDLPAWRERLRVALEHGGYRDAGFTVDDAARALVSPEATAEQRVGAALALRVAGVPPDRIRVAADRAARSELAEALHAVADDNPEAPRKLARVLGD